MADSAPDLLAHLAACVEAGKLDANTDLPPGSLGQPGVTELVSDALAAGLPAQTILNDGLLPGMQAIGRKFAANEVFIPEVLIAARAMKAGVALLKPALTADPVPARGEFIIGTVRGDLHDIGKNLVAIILEGAGWHVHDLGIDCPPERFLAAIEARPGAVVGLSALLTTTMIHMQQTVQAIRQKCTQAIILVGGAPVTAAFAEKIGANGYAADPMEAVALLDKLCPRTC